MDFAVDCIAPGKQDLDTPAAIHRLIMCFYARVLRQPALQPFFNAARLTDRLPMIEAYWERMLLDGQSYRRNMVNVHREIHRRRAIDPAAFDSWLSLFVETVDREFSGPKSERAKFLARAIIGNLRRILLNSSPTA